jgi:hypothetical protein
MADARPLIARIQVEHGSAGSFGQSDSEGSGGGDRVQQQIAKNTGPRGVNATLQKAMHTTYKNIQKKASLQTLGISLSIASLLKQSQIFTSSLGAIFQLIGAMIDLFLAPLVKPVLIPFIKWMARNMPMWVENAHAMLATLRDAIRPILEKIWSMIPQVAKDNMGYLIAFLAGNYFIKKLTGVNIIGIATKPITALATGIFMGLGVMLAPYLVAVVASLGTLLAALAPLAILGSAVFINFYKQGKLDKILSWLGKMFGQNKGMIDLGGGVVKEGSVALIAKEVKKDPPVIVHTSLSEEEKGDKENKEATEIMVDYLETKNNRARDAFMNAFQKRVREIFGVPIGSFPQGDDLLTYGANLFMDQGKAKTSGVFMGPTLTNPLGQGYSYTFHVTLDAGILANLGYQRVKIEGQNSGTTTAQAVVVANDYYLGSSGEDDDTPGFGAEPLQEHRNKHGGVFRA